MSRTLGSSFYWEVKGMECVPAINNNRLSKKVKIGEGFFANVYRSFMTFPWGGSVPVALKEGKHGSPQENLQLWNEALIMLKVRSVAGVPKLYGMTTTTPRALVMSFCPGLPIKTWMKAEGVRVYLEAVASTCLIVSTLHKLGIVHRDLHNDNILVSTKKSRGVRSVVLIDFGEAKLSHEQIDQAVDACKLKFMVRQIVSKMTSSSDVTLYRKCQEFQKTVDETRSVHGLMTVITRMLRSNVLPAQLRRLRGAQ